MWQTVAASFAINSDVLFLGIWNAWHHTNGLYGSVKNNNQRKQKSQFEIIVAQKAITTPVVVLKIQTPEGAHFSSLHSEYYVSNAVSAFEEFVLGIETTVHSNIQKHIFTENQTQFFLFADVIWS